MLIELVTIIIWKTELVRTKQNVKKYVLFLFWENKVGPSA